MDADTSSPFSLSNLTGNTDTTVYPTPPRTHTQPCTRSDIEYSEKDNDDVNINDTKYAKHPALDYDNPTRKTLRHVPRIRKINEVISKQIEEMAPLVVRGFYFHFQPDNLQIQLVKKWKCGSY